MAIKKHSRGFALLISVIFMSVMLSLGIALASLGYKQTILASTATESQYAFYAADAALECALYADQQQNLFAPPKGGTPLLCDGGSTTVSTSTASGYLISTATISLDSNTRCANIAVYKPTSSGTTYLYSNGYDVSCATAAGAPANGARFVVRGLNAHY